MRRQRLYPDGTEVYRPMLGIKAEIRPRLLVQPVIDTALVSHAYIDDIPLHDDLHANLLIQPVYRCNAGFREPDDLVVRRKTQSVAMRRTGIAPQKTAVFFGQP